MRLAICLFLAPLLATATNHENPPPAISFAGIQPAEGTPNSQGTFPIALEREVRFSDFGFLSDFGFRISDFSLAPPPHFLAATDPPATAAAPVPITNFHAYYLAIYQAAKTRFEASTNDATTAWQFSRACFDLGEFATNDTERAAVAEEGIAAARAAVFSHPRQAAGHYYLGMNLGQLARTKNLGALKLVKEMTSSFEVARHLDPKFDYAGADRCLGLLYRDAPGWPISVGSKRQARQYLLQAVQVAPDYPDNQLNLVESLVMWDERKAAAARLATVEATLVKARTNLVGPPWAASWRDWTNRWHSLTNRLGKP